MTLADHHKAALGWKPSQRPLHTSANRECGSCHAIKLGVSSAYPSHWAGRPQSVPGVLANHCGKADSMSLLDQRE
jgi:hypothetical protein